MATDVIRSNLEKFPKRFVNNRKLGHNSKDNKTYIDGVNLNGIVSRVHSLFEKHCYSNAVDKRRLRYAKKGYLMLS